jgi:hypothetical protein
VHPSAALMLPSSSHNLGSQPSAHAHPLPHPHFGPGIHAQSGDGCDGLLQRQQLCRMRQHPDGSSPSDPSDDADTDTAVGDAVCSTNTTSAGAAGGGGGLKGATSYRCKRAACAAAFINKAELRAHQKAFHTLEATETRERALHMELQQVEQNHAVLREYSNMLRKLLASAQVKVSRVINPFNLCGSRPKRLFRSSKGGSGKMGGSDGHSGGSDPRGGSTDVDDEGSTSSPCSSSHGEEPDSEDDDDNDDDDGDDDSSSGGGGGGDARLRHRLRQHRYADPQHMTGASPPDGARKPSAALGDNDSNEHLGSRQHWHVDAQLAGRHGLIGGNKRKSCAAVAAVAVTSRVPSVAEVHAAAVLARQATMAPAATATAIAVQKRARTHDPPTRDYSHS